MIHKLIIAIWNKEELPGERKESIILPIHKKRDKTDCNNYRGISGTAVAQWLRCCATNRKVTGSIPDGVIGVFHWHNPSNRTMALGSTQPLTEMNTRRISWG